MPYIQQVYDEWPDENVVILTINIGDSADKVAEFFQENSLSLPVLLDTQAELAIKYLVSSYPLSFFIDKEGGFRGVWPGALSSAEQLTEILNWLTGL
jgi:cytochrome c-type biogenesis protein